MKVCPTNGLQPTMLETGVEGIWTPHLVPEIGQCEYSCTLCGNVCPTGAITKITPKQKETVKLGTAKVDRSICIAWAYNQECLVCEEHCPISDKAIKIVEEVVMGNVVKKPVVDPNLCVGCGICQNKCPVRPVRAIKVSPKGADRV
jgi:ferredoxin